MSSTAHKMEVIIWIKTLTLKPEQPQTLQVLSGKSTSKGKKGITLQTTIIPSNDVNGNAINWKTLQKQINDKIF